MSDAALQGVTGTAIDSAAGELPPVSQPEALKSETLKSVPYPRFQEVIGERNQLKTQLEEMQVLHKNTQEELGQARNELGQTRDELNAAARTALRLRVAYTAGLPLELAERLLGEDEETLAQDAARLLHFVRPSTGPGVPPPPAAARPAKVDLDTMSAAEVRKRKDEILRGAKG